MYLAQDWTDLVAKEGREKLKIWIRQRVGSRKRREGNEVKETGWVYCHGSSSVVPEQQYPIANLKLSAGNN